MTCYRGIGFVGDWKNKEKLENVGNPFWRLVNFFCCTIASFIIE